MDDALKSVTWEGLEHYHIEKRGDWFWALGILTVTAAFAAFFLGNYLFGILIILSGGIMALVANREPDMIPFAVTTRGVRINDELFPYSRLESYYIDTEMGHEPLLLLRSEQILNPILVIPIPEDFIEEIEELVAARLPEEHLEEPFIHKILEFFGF